METGSPTAAGVQIGKYRVLRRLASGGMGEVFLARVDGPGGFEKTLVLKRVLKKLQGQPRFVEMFLNEARVAAQLSHPNVVQIFELAELDGGYVIAMEYVEGLSLRALMSAAKRQQVSLPAPLAAYVCAQALQGLHYAHLLRDERGRVRGVVHRDVSPENVLLGFHGAVKVADFGLARAAEAAVDQVPLGKMAYMAPEQRLGTLIDARADVYAMGVVLAEMLTGAPVDGLLGRPRLADPTLDLIVGRALTPHPDGRYLSAAEMAGALEEYVRTHSDANATRLGELVRLASLKSGPQSGEVAGALTQLTLPASAPEAQSSAPEAKAEDVQAVSSNPEPPRLTLPSVPARSRARWLIPVGVLGVVGVMVVVAGLIETANPVLPERSRGAESAFDPSLTRPSSTPLGQNGINGSVQTPPVVIEAPPPSPVREKRVRPGLVQVRVHPWAEVFWGGKSLGTTPLPPVALPAGRQVLTLKNGELNVTREVVVTVKSDAEVSVFENFLK